MAQGVLVDVRVDHEKERVVLTFKREDPTSPEKAFEASLALGEKEADSLGFMLLAASAELSLKAPRANPA